MIAPELHAQIRRLFYAEHWRLNTIAAQLGVHHDTVCRAVESERFIRPGTQVRPSALDPYKAFLLATLEQYPRLRATRLWAMVRERGYSGSAIQVQRYVRTVRPAARAEAYLRLDTLPGEQAQVDWGNFGPIRVGSTTRLLSCFVLVLSWSRACYARFALDQTLESFLRGHVEAFAALGGVPRTILYDNLKSVVLERVGDHIRFHPRVLELAGHYHFAPQPCAVARGNEKGCASHCTSSVGIGDGCQSPRGRPALPQLLLVLVLDRAVGSRGLEQALGFVVVGVGAQQARPAPDLDCLRRDVELLRDFPLVEHSGRSQSIIPTAEVVLRADPTDQQRMKWLAGAGAVATLVQDRGNRRVRVFVEQRVDLGDHIRARLP
jgi:transposase